MKKRIFSTFLCLTLLAGLLVVPGMVASADTITWQDGAVGQYAIVTEAPDETPLNQGIRPKQGASSTEFGANPNWGSSGNLANLTDGDLTNRSVIYFSQVGTTQYWENITFDLGAVKQVDRALVGSADAGPRNVYVKFYASTELATLYDASNLMAETKDGLSATELTVLLKGEAKAARYVGISTYLFNANQDRGKYPNIAGYSNQMRFNELAVYEAPILWTEYDITATNNTDKIVATGDNLLATATATASAQQTLVTDGNIAGIVDGSGIWDSLFGGDDGSPAYTAFDLGSRHVIDSLLVGGGGNDTFANIGCGTYGVDVYISDYTREQIQSDPTLVEPVYTTTDTIVFGRLVELAEAATGRYVVFALYGAPSSSLKTKIWLSELAATGYAADAPTAQGAQVRGTDALRFGFDLVANGVAYADADPLSSGNYTRDLSGTTITVNGTPYELKDFGAVVSLSAEDALTLDSAATDATGKTKAVSAEKLYSIIGNTVRFTAVVINIPAGKGDTPLYARAYVTYNDGTKDVTLYGDKITRSVNQCTAEALG